MLYLDFEIDVTGGDRGSYTVKVRSPAGEATSSMRFPFDQPTLTNRLQALQIALLRSSMTRRRIASPESQTVQEFGQELWKALFSGDVLSRYEASLQEAKHDQAGIRIKFRCDEPELAALPWEYLYDPMRGGFVALSANTPLVRYIPLPESMPPFQVRPPIRILAVAVSPSDLDGLDVERERSRLNAAMEPIIAKGRVELTWMSGQTWQDFTDVMLEGPWHILHFIGHGGFDENRQEGIVAFARADGRADYKRATSLGLVLGDHKPLRLAVLNACETGRSDVTDLFSSTSGTLVRKGTPAVVAMQYAITDEAAIALSRSFYNAVAKGMPVDAALSVARQGLATTFEDTLEWGTPVLYLQAADGVLFDIAAAPVVAPPKAVETVPVDEPASVGDALGITVAGIVAGPQGAAPPIEPPPVEPPPAEPIEPGPGPTPEPGPGPEPIPVPRPTGGEPAKPEAKELERPVPVPPPRPPRNRFPIALAAGGGAAALAIVLIANLLGGGGGVGGSASPNSSVAAGSNSPSGGSPSASIDAGGSASASIDAGGHGILFQFYTEPPEELNSPTSEIYLYDLDTHKARPLTQNNVADRWPRWSPDGTLIAFTRIENGSSRIWLMDADGNNERPLTGGPDDAVPDIRLDGLVAFTRGPEGSATAPRDIWGIKVDESGLEPLVDEPGDDDSAPAWAPDGQIMAFSKERDGVSGRAIYMYEGGEPEPFKTGSIVYRNPRWNSDGDQLVYTRTRADRTRDVWTLDVATKKEHQETDVAADEGAPVYSPNGDKIAFFRKSASTKRWHIVIRVLASGKESDITKGLVGNSIDPSWR